MLAVVVKPMNYKLRAYPTGHIQTNAFLLSDPSRGEAVLIDAPHFAWDEIQTALKEDGCELKALLLTHGHYDHIGDAAKIAEKGVPLYGHQADRKMFETPEMMRPYAYPESIELVGFQIDHWVKQGDVLQILGLDCEVRHVPGHCPGNVLFYFESLELAFVGDALFAGSIGRTDLPGGDFNELERSIRERIYTLPEEVTVLPGHGPSTTVGEEKKYNPYVSAQ
ncbi:MBL fold metallo-hydrolase [Pelagicoccus sp. SDUM812003]|uniref:MBL fold metallo-hydrolase n=1 Tax=Pelagicoccus sp. SDUM812003 TaxID=3041267 RepID=UPI00280DD250|nr:MBL fold metallo-hydrolase [Pelagicoccus sp. SDUM812003]MDQ8204509.1 MBL fold metallo-hydrolase [Pelagicoccus sp. SDUM812003]